MSYQVQRVQWGGTVFKNAAVGNNSGVSCKMELESTVHSVNLRTYCREPRCGYAQVFPRHDDMLQYSHRPWVRCWAWHVVAQPRLQHLNGKSRVRSAIWTAVSAVSGRPQKLADLRCPQLRPLRASGLQRVARVDARHPRSCTH